ncbi:hypothetical protein [Salinigranum halophilum]|jgi:hypothetical protein|uniref:hypothetical protein n=1 Tax=Salinigranum halophilum TaxID=2565931 RepID=UPI0010A85D90|nr:hypothetical protein [Salinigranum halophilum]
MGLVDSVIGFVVSLLVGGFGIYVGARFVVDEADYGHAVVTALIGAVVWAVVGLFLGWIPLLGVVFTLVAYVAVVNWRYPGGWVEAAGIALVAWAASLVTLAVLSFLGVGSLSAFGIPGV